MSSPDMGRIDTAQFLQFLGPLKVLSGTVGPASANGIRAHLELTPNSNCNGCIRLIGCELGRCVCKSLNVGCAKIDLCQGAQLIGRDCTSGNGVKLPSQNALAEIVDRYTGSEEGIDVSERCQLAADRCLFRQRRIYDYGIVLVPESR